MRHPSGNQEFESELRALVGAGRRMEAVRRYRERTGTSLRETEAAVAALARQEGITQRETDSVEWDVISLLERGLKAQAVAFYRERMGCGAREAQDAVERIAAEHSIPTRGHVGCLSALALGIFWLIGVALTAA